MTAMGHYEGQDIQENGLVWIKFCCLWCSRSRFQKNMSGDTFMREIVYCQTGKSLTETDRIVHVVLLNTGDYLDYIVNIWWSVGVIVLWHLWLNLSPLTEVDLSTQHGRNSGKCRIPPNWMILKNT